MKASSISTPSPGISDGLTHAVGVERVGNAADLVAERVVLGDVALEIAGQIDRRERVDGRGHVDAGRRGVRVERQLPRIGHAGDPHRFGDAAGLGQVRLHDS